MKKIIFFLLALLSIVTESSAQTVSGMPLGYCNGIAAGKSNINSAKKNVWLSAAIYIPAGQINTYAGNHLDSIRVALAMKLHVDTVKVWLRNALDGPDLAEGTIVSDNSKAQIKKGWNRIALNTPYQIEKTDKGLYIGYSFHQKGAASALASLTTATPNGLFVQMPDEAWKDRSTEGTLCIEGLVYGNHLPKINLALTSLDAQDIYVVDKGSMKLLGTVKNIATQTITGFDVVAAVEGIDETYTTHVDADIAFNQTYAFDVTINPAITEVGNGKGKVTVTIARPNGEDDEDPTDNVMTDEFGIVNHDFTRNILVEEFTTEQCTNCPRMAGYIHNALEKDAYKDHVLVACHHSGYYTDWLTSTCDNSYLWFYNAGGQTYAPAIMVDRQNVGGSTPVFMPESQEIMENYWDYCLSQPAFVSVNVSASIEGSDPQKIKIKVNGSKSLDKLCDNPMLVVYVLEDNIEARSQAGAASFTHNHVKRAFNSTWGEPVEWNGNDYEYNCEFDVSTAWKQSDLQVVAYIYNYDENDPTNCAVANAGSIRYKDFDKTSIRDIHAAGAASQTEYFTLSGVRISPEQAKKGVYLVKKDGKTQKMMLGE